MQRRNLIEKTVIAGTMMVGLSGKFGMRQESERSYPVVNGDDYEATCREILAVMNGDVAPSYAEPSPMDKDDHRKTSTRRDARSPNVQIEAVFTHAILIQELHGPRKVFLKRHLHTAWTEGIGRAHSLPRFHGNGWFPAEVADWRFCERNAFKRQNAFDLVSTPGDLPGSCTNDLTLTWSAGGQEKKDAQHSQDY
jgi:hypothetical protein